jgi:hypothetical protein
MIIFLVKRVIKAIIQISIIVRDVKKDMCWNRKGLMKRMFADSTSLVIYIICPIWIMMVYGIDLKIFQELDVLIEWNNVHMISLLMVKISQDTQETVKYVWTNTKIKHLMLYFQIHWWDVFFIIVMKLLARKDMKVPRKKKLNVKVANLDIIWLNLEILVNKGAGLISPVKNLNIQSNLMEFGIDHKKFLEQIVLIEKTFVFQISLHWDKILQVFWEIVNFVTWNFKKEL